MTQGGWKRDCPNCKAEHFPRTDPVVIMLVTSGEKCLLGRAEALPARMYSCLRRIRRSRRSSSRMRFAAKSSRNPGFAAPT